MSVVRHDVIIVGAGIVGLSTALMLAKQNIDVLLIDKNPCKHWSPDNTSARTVALTQTSLNFLARYQLLDDLPRAAYAPMRAMQVWDQGRQSHIAFHAGEFSQLQLGSIVFNQALQAHLWQQAQQQKNITLLEAELESVSPNACVTVKHEAGQQSFRAQLLIAADGANSFIRKKLAIALKKVKDYQQQAMVAIVATEKTHQQTAYQVFLETGPIGLLPLRHGKQMAMVWSCKNEAASRLLQSGQAAMAEQLSHYFAPELGQCEFITAPAAIPLIAREAESYVSDRVVLLGDAAHNIHPLAGLGVNLGLQDVKSLVEKIAAAKANNKNFVSRKLLHQYEASRALHNRVILESMSALQALYVNQNDSLTQARQKVLGCLNKQSLIKQLFLETAP